MNFRRIVFVSSFDYPTRFAHARHGLEMAKAYEKLCSGRFIFLVNAALEPLPVRYGRLFGPFGRRVKKLRLRRVLMPLSLLWFFIRLGVGRETLVVTTDPKIGWLLMPFKRMFGFRCIIELHGVPDARVLAAVTGADALIIPAEGIRSAIIKERPELASRIRVVPNAVDVAAFDAVTDDRHVLRGELGLPDAPVLIGYIGRFEPRGEDKGLRLMIDALRGLPEAHLALVGGTKYEAAAYQDYAESAGVADRVIIVPFVDARLVPKYAKACDILAYVPPSSPFTETETSPMKLYEYMAARRPLVVSDTAALRAITRHDSAYLVTSGDEAAYQEAIKQILQDSADTSRRVLAAYEKVKGNTWNSRADTILDRYL